MRHYQQRSSVLVKVLALILLVMVSLVVLGASETAPCTIFQVQPEESIQAAIDQAPEGAVICLAEGTWEENIKIEKSLTLRGAGREKTVIKGAERCYPIIWVASPEQGVEIEVQISGISVNDAYGYWCADLNVSAHGFLVQGHANVAITSCEILRNTESGIRLVDFARVRVTDCVITANGMHGVHAVESAEVLINDCSISDNAWSGIYVDDSACVTLTNNEIHDNEDAGIGSFSDQTVQGVDNDISGNGVDLVGNVMGAVRLPLCEARETEIVYPNQDYEDLQQAIDALLPGGKLILQEGDYIGGLTISKELQMEAEQGAFVTLWGASDWIPVISLVEGADLNLSEMIVTGGYDGLYAGADAQVKATKCTITENENSGVALSDFAQGDLVECTISSNGNHGFGLRGSAGAAISACTISGNYEDGVHLSGFAQATVLGCTISGNYCGIHLEGSSQATLEKNTATENQYGVASFADHQAARGRGNHVWGNSTDLAGSASRTLLLSGVEPTEIEIVYPDLSYETLQQAIDALLPGGRLILRAGEYEAGVIVYRELRVEPEQGAEVVLTAKNEDAPVFLLIDGANLHLSGITITGGKGGLRAVGDAQAELASCTITGNDGEGIALSDSAQAMITDCTILENEEGVRLSGSAKATITDCTIKYNAEAGIASSSDQVVEGSGNRVFANGIDLDGNVAEALRVPAPEEEMVIFYPSHHYDTLQEAIDALPAGGTLLLKEGKYDVAVTVSKEISIRPLLSREVVLHGATEDQPAFLLTEGANLNLSGATITGGEDGLRMEGDAQARVTNCMITENGDAMELFDSAQVVITACTVSENDRGIILRNLAQIEISDSLITANADDGIWLFDSSHATVTDCTITDHQYECQNATTVWDYLLCYFHYLSGIHLQDDAEATITRCTISGNDAGVTVRNSARATVQDCTITENNKTGGLYLQGSAQVDIVRCTSAKNKYGLYLDGPGQVDVSSCTLSGNEDSGVYLGGSAHARILDCSISGNDGPGIELQSSAEATISMNTIADNTGAGIISSSDHPVAGSGNRFSGNGVDLQGNITGGVRLPLYEPAQTEIVYPSEPYESLQGAIDALLPGGRLVLQEGEYKGGLTLSKEVQIEAQEGAEVVVRGVSEKAPVFSLITGAKLRLSGVTVTGGEDGIIAATDAQLEIEKCVVTGNSDDGIELAGTARATLAQCRIGVNNDKGIQLQNSAQAEIARCTITGNSDGLYLSGSAQADVSFCTLSGNEQQGVYLESSAQAVITNCMILENGEGVSLSSSAQATLQANTITNNAGAGITSSSDQTIEGGGNYLYGNGVDLQGSVEGEIRLLLREPTQIEIVYPNEAYQSLQEAIDALLPGGRLILKEGEYEEQLTISKEVQIEAQEGAEVVLRGVSDTMPVISLIPSANLELYGITVTGGEYGLYTASDAQALLDQCTITGNKNGIALLGTAQATLVGCMITENGNTGIDLQDSTLATITQSTITENIGDGICLSWGSAKATIVDCTITANNGTGIEVSSSAEATITESTITENGDGGIDLSGSATAMITDCTLTTNGDTGIELRDSSQASITKCQISENHGDGVHLIDSSKVEITNSTLSHNVFSGLYLGDESHAHMADCEILQNVHGVELMDSSQLATSKTSIHESRYSAIDLSDSARASLTNAHLHHNTLGVRLRSHAQAELVNCTIEENSSGMLLVDSTQAQITDCLLTGNTWDGISLWDDTEISVERSSCVNNGRYGVAVGGEPYSLQATEGITAELVAQGAYLTYPKEPPEAVREAADSVVEIWTDGWDEVTDEYWPFSAQGVILASGEILTVAHVFYGEDMHNPDVWLDLDAVQVRDPDKEIALLEMEDLIKGQTSHGLHPAAMDHSRDLAALYPKQELHKGLPVAEGTAPHEMVWLAAQIYERNEWKFIPGTVSIPPRKIMEAWYEAFVENERPFFLTDLRVRLSEETEHGFSGAPILNATGEVIGVIVRGTSFQSYRSTGVSLATPIPQLKRP